MLVSFLNNDLPPPIFVISFQSLRIFDGFTDLLEVFSSLEVREPRGLHGFIEQRLMTHDTKEIALDV